VFEGHKSKKAAQEYQAALTHWQESRDEYAHLLELAREFAGSPSSEILLGSTELLFYAVSGAALVEQRHEGHYSGRSAGISVPLGSIGGRPVRYRVGASRGHYVQTTSTPTAVDTGTVYVTNKRVIFVGAKQTRECGFAKLIGFHHEDQDGATTFSVSNRQKPTTIHYGPELSASFDFRLDLALAHYKGTVADLVAQLTDDLTRIDEERPAAPEPDVD
jgi:hypothetical protein